jgi:hypothetical protein
MAYKRKYRKGDKITSLDELVKQEFVYVHGKITHVAWAKSWQVSLALMYIERGSIYYAEKIEEVTNDG